MATFSFTIPAADVDTVKNTTGQSSFEAVADRGLSRQSKHRVLTAKFGDGYEQRVLDGINTKDDMFSISFNNRASEDINLIAGFLDNKAGKNFDFVITDTFSSGNLSTSTLKVVCDGYNISYGHSEHHSLNCQLRRVYEP
jgi:phage-related protein